jgi:hypothetical protein
MPRVCKAVIKAKEATLRNRSNICWFA